MRIGLYTFDVDFHILTTPTDDYVTLGAIADKIDIARWHAGTSTYHGLQSLAGAIGATGDGSSAAAPQTYVMFMSDGTTNSADNITETNWSTAATAYPPFDGVRCWSMDPPPDSGPYYPPIGDPVAGACVPDPWTPTHSGNGQMQIQSVDPGWCQRIKDKNATLMTLYTEYLLSPAASTDPSNWMTNEWRFTYIDNFVIPKIKPAMQACASSPDVAFVGKDTAGIASAVDQMFKKAIYSGVRLSK
ncbi:MAG: VWA domain-containing protein [Rhodoblastus sp.]|nr:MAG: VWA domain-containing protein [Rhodoblastus sp.]